MCLRPITVRTLRLRSCIYGREYVGLSTLGSKTLKSWRLGNQKLWSRCVEIPIYSSLVPFYYTLGPIWCMFLNLFTEKLQESLETYSTFDTCVRVHHWCNNINNELDVTLIIFSQVKHQIDATLCRFYFCRVTLQVSGASAHHQEY